MIRPFVFVALTLLLTACGSRGAADKGAAGEVRSDAVAITDAWCRPTPNGATAGACYATIRSTDANRLTGAATPVAAAVAIHDMRMEGGMMRMSEMTGGLDLPAGRAVTLAPGGRHLMLTGLTAPLVAGQAVSLTLTFSASEAMTVQAPIRQPAA